MCKIVLELAKKLQKMTFFVDFPAPLKVALK